MERYVECESRGLTLRGMLHVPDQRPGKVPFVILFHGFCDDPERDQLRPHGALPQAV